MRGKANPEILKQIAAIRELQRLAAETKVIRAASAAREKEEFRAESESRRQSLEAGCLASMSGPSLRVDTVPLWLAMLGKQDAIVRQATKDNETASVELERRARDWHAAIAHCDIAKDMTRVAVQERVREREEAALQDASDRYVQRRSIR